MVTPEDKAREKIDQLLEAAGWALQDMEGFNRNAALGVAVREYQLPSGPCDYLLFVEGKACGVVEAKKEGHTLSGVSDQSEKYMSVLPDFLAKWQDTLVFDYESTGTETLFRDMRDPNPRSRRVFAFHKPETLHGWLTEAAALRKRLTEMPPLDERGLRDCQIEAIEGLEASLSEGRPRALIQMATGAGKTFTACTFSYRLIKYGGAKRILFLVDRNNLGDQTLKEFQNFAPPGSAYRFSENYIVQHLQKNKLDKDAKVVITTIQRMYSMLRGEELEEDLEEASAFETWEVEDGEIKPVSYNPDIPIETFDFIVTDECHRSIYGLWRQVLEYFDAFVIGLTATPSKHTLGFFGQNLVAEYPYERSVADGVNVGYEVFRIKTKITEKGNVGDPVSAEFQVPVRDKKTRAVRYRQLDEELEYKAGELDRSVTAPNQIRTVLQAFRDNLFTNLFPGRSGKWVPKTLIFAKDDNHAEEITHIVREVFNEGNDFAKKITYRNTGEAPKAMIKAFRVDPLPRIAVTVDMIATGTDIKPVEVVLFMRDVKSEGYFEQMKGRGVRSIENNTLQEVTPDATTKTRFILVDAVGVTETKKNIAQPLERKRTVAFDKLLEQVASGRRDEDALSSLAARLAVLEKKIEREDHERIIEATGGMPLRKIANELLDAIDPDLIEAEATRRFGAAPTEKQLDEVSAEKMDQACQLFDDPQVRTLISDIKKKSEIIIDDFTTDQVTHAEFDKNLAGERTKSFREFIEAHKNELLALEILYTQPYGKKKITYAALKELSQKMADPPHYFMLADLWQAYRRLNADVVKGAPVEDQLTDMISLVRFAVGLDKELEPFGVKVEQRFNLWVGRQKKAGVEFSAEQLNWLRLIKNHIAANAEMTRSDLMDIPQFSDLGGAVKAKALFGADLDKVITDLNQALVA